METYDVFIPQNESLFDDVLSNTGRIQWLSLGSNPGFTFIQNVMYHLGFSSQDFLMCFALFSVVVYFWFIRKHSEDIVFSVFLFFRPPLNRGNTHLPVCSSHIRNDPL